MTIEQFCLNRNSTSTFTQTSLKCPLPSPSPWCLKPGMGLITMAVSYVSSWFFFLGVMIEFKLYFLNFKHLQSSAGKRRKSRAEENHLLTPEITTSSLRRDYHVDSDPHPKSQKLQNYTCSMLR